METWRHDVMIRLTNASHNAWSVELPETSRETPGYKSTRDPSVASRHVDTSTSKHPMWHHHLLENDTPSFLCFKAHSISHQNITNPQKNTAWKIPIFNIVLELFCFIFLGINYWEMNGNREGCKESLGVKMEGGKERLVYMWGYLPGALPQKSPLLSPVVVKSVGAGSSWKDVCGGGCGFAMAISGNF